MDRGRALETRAQTLDDLPEILIDAERLAAADVRKASQELFQTWSDAFNGHVRKDLFGGGLDLGRGHIRLGRRCSAGFDEGDENLKGRLEFLRQSIA